MSVCLGAEAFEVGTLSFEARGTRRVAAFSYADGWLENPERFALSPDLPLVSGYQYRANKDPGQSAFFGCFADVEPDGWGRMVIKRDYARQRKESDGGRLATGLLDDFDFLLWVNDFSRMGAIRFRDDQGVFQRCSDGNPGGKRETPALVQLPHLLSASKAVEENKERALKTWISEGAGETASVGEALAVAPLFGFAPGAEWAVLNQVRLATGRWKDIAKTIGMSAADIDDFAPAFAHPELLA